jgi:hypothetical protein
MCYNMNFENIMLSEISQTQRANAVWVHFYEVPRVGKFVQTENRLEVTMDWKEKEWRIIV